ncbi:VSP [Giardia duodenalis]|uniref:VSP n=1 Tax=Giardia intestinalis (strain ATCC 50803 / WB clone C6) TaxID=184922 RepID=A8B3V9_GIAIC|nr:VSP [Giardia intestinalis]XP_001710324.1 VSP [Giardia intestinalis]KAE8303243.1 VSP [Giardia intestinalis]KAE8303244.1 VSP [Giardia intestinalis]|eukprot:XP_001710323.1 VSP [Giardia lamblia ATCC 50803]
MLLVAFYFVLSALAAECSAEGTAKDNCEANHCEMVGGTEICTQCQTGKVPIDGQCAGATDSNTKCKNADGVADADQTCGKCLLETFMYKGGCYVTTKAPGNVMCGDAAAGKCTQVKAGYFLPPGADNAHDSVVSCGDTTGVTLTDNKKYTGVAGCGKCEQPGEAQNGTPKAATCTECQADKYLKTESGTTSCVDEGNCNNGFFPTTDAQSNNKKVCALCSEADKGGIADCKKCSLKATSARAGPMVTCSECTNNNLSPLKDECMLGCPAGTYANNKVCTLCHESCAGCQTDDKETSCTACYPGSVLEHDGDLTTGKCIQECTGRYAENCEAGQCTAVVGGSKYCSRCKTGFVPINGMCVSTTARAATECVAGEGVCTSCTGAYFLESGGCYKTGAFPGNTLCIAAGANGKCANCANGQNADPQTGACPPCPANCSKCSGDSDVKTCTECYSGYYLDTGKECKKCSETSGNIQGVPNCVSCKAPSSPNAPTPVTCYVKTDATNNGDNDNNGGSTNKSGLSTGAIAGISVAVVVVVGGLVGFLCWWFICRGKA